MSVVLLTDNLTTASAVEAAARGRQLRAAVAINPESVLALASDERPDLVIIDLSARDADVEEIVRSLRALEPPPRTIVAFAPHVHERKLQSAERAGCDEVLSQGKFRATLDDLLARYTRPA